MLLELNCSAFCIQLNVEWVRNIQLKIVESGKSSLLFSHLMYWATNCLLFTHLTSLRHYYFVLFKQIDRNAFIHEHIVQDSMLILRRFFSIFTRFLRLISRKTCSDGILVQFDGKICQNMSVFLNFQLALHLFWRKDMKSVLFNRFVWQCDFTTESRFVVFLFRQIEQIRARRIYGSYYFGCKRN